MPREGLLYTVEGLDGLQFTPRAAPAKEGIVQRSPDNWLHIGMLPIPTNQYQVSVSVIPSPHATTGWVCLDRDKKVVGR